MHGKELNSELRKVSLHGETRDCLRSWNLEERDRSWQG